MKVLQYFVFSSLFFCLEPMVRENTYLVETASVTAMVNFLKLVDHSYVHKLLLQELRDTLTKALELKICRHGSTDVLILSWLVIMKQKLTKRCLENYQLHKSQVCTFKTLHQNRGQLLRIVVLFLSKKPSF